jgi:hypothetical protein
MTTIKLDFIAYFSAVSAHYFTDQPVTAHFPFFFGAQWGRLTTRATVTRGAKFSFVYSYCSIELNTSAPQGS